MDWKISFSIGVEEIDSQHRELIDLFRSIVASIEAGDSWSDTHYRIVDLRRFAEFHFQFEEGLMRMFGYPQAEAHAGNHKDFFTRLEAIERISLQDSVHEEMVKFLYDWLTDHILHCDKEYARHLLSGARVVPSVIP